MLFGASLKAHPAVLDEPTPWVLVDALGSSSIAMRAYFWFDFSRFSEQKLKSALLRQSLRALEAAGISAPDDAREIIFPQGVPILSEETAARRVSSGEGALPPPDVGIEDGAPEHEGEGGLDSDAASLKEQADSARTPEEGENLL